MNLIPEFKAGDRVMVRPQGFEMPCPACKRHLSCNSLAAPFQAEIQHEEKFIPMCACCGRIFLEKSTLGWLVKRENRERWCVPWTWLTPLGESHE